MKKIFGIGLPKTGQTSLASAMRILGYKSYQYPYTKAQIDKHDFVLDLPVTLAYQELDKQYPRSKFIMTIRDYDSWLNSLRNHYRRFPASKRYKEQLEFRRKFWGTIRFNKRIMTLKYHEHYQQVLNYFSKRKKSLLVIDITNREGWGKLCKFLDKQIPATPFPWKNVGKYKS